MFAKVLKRKVSRAAVEAPDPSNFLIAEGSQGYPSPSTSSHFATASLSSPPSSMSSSGSQLPFQYAYKRPEFLGKLDEREGELSTNHAHRLVLAPKSPLAADTGYAEVINSGKSKFNEDQAAIAEGVLKGINDVEIPYLYFGLFDGHGGAGAGIKCAKEFHKLLHEGLEDVLPYMLNPDKLKSESDLDESVESGSNVVEVDVEGDDSGQGYELDRDEFYATEVKMTIDELVVGTLESSFWAMDRKILMEKDRYRITGGATAVVALFISGKLYVANAGDSRAAVFWGPAEPQLHVMSYDFTPMNDRRRIQEIAYHRPDLIRHPETKEKLFNRHILSRTVTKEDIGIGIMYKDFYMTGWSCRDVTSDDVNLVPIISGRGKQCRLLSTVGVARSLGDHDLLAKGSGIRIKDFLTPQPEVRILDLRQKTLTGDEVLVMASDGLWDVLSNDDVRKVLADEAGEDPSSMAKHLVTTARGERMPESYWEMKGSKKLASGDDISCFVIPLKKAKRM